MGMTKGSTQAVGSTLGGAVGTAYGGPVGGAVGSVAGGMIGGLFGSDESVSNQYNGQYDGLIHDYGEKAKGKNLVSSGFYKKYMNRAHSGTMGRQASQRGASRNLAQRNISSARNKTDIVEAENTTTLNQQEMEQARKAHMELMQAREGMGAADAKMKTASNLRKSDRTQKLIQGGLNTYSAGKDKEDAENQHAMDLYTKNPEEYYRYKEFKKNQSSSPIGGSFLSGQFNGLASGENRRMS